MLVLKTVPTVFLSVTSLLMAGLYLLGMTVKQALSFGLLMEQLLARNYSRTLIRHPSALR